jgi:hypothetical protein
LRTGWKYQIFCTGILGVASILLFYTSFDVNI